MKTKVLQIISLEHNRGHLQDTEFVPPLSVETSERYKNKIAMAQSPSGCPKHGECGRAASVVLVSG